VEICEYPTAEEAASAAAELLVRHAGEAIRERKRFLLALSGGSTPWKMLRCLSERDLVWQRVNIIQVDERIAADDDEARNLVHIQRTLADPVDLPPENLHAMPVVDENLENAAARYAHELAAIAGEPPVLDVVHLGLGEDGHTASLIPGDPVLNVSNHDVAITDRYKGHRRMTLTYSIINRARHILWLITGAAKADMVNRMIQSDRDIPAGRVSHKQATVIADTAALSVHRPNSSWQQSKC
jgi:6-phosphogluconolactonase